MPRHRFKLGDPKPPGSGRKKGSLNKLNLLNLPAAQRLAELGHDPLQELSNLAVKASHDGNYDLLFRILELWCSYLYPKRKAIEHSGVIDANINVSIEQPLEALRHRVTELIARRGQGDVLQLAPTGTDSKD